MSNSTKIFILAVVIIATFLYNAIQALDIGLPSQLNGDWKGMQEISVKSAALPNQLIPLLTNDNFHGVEIRESNGKHIYHITHRCGVVACFAKVNGDVDPLINEQGYAVINTSKGELKVYASRKFKNSPSLISNSLIELENTLDELLTSDKLNLIEDK